MSTRALLAIYENGKLTATYFHHWDGYVNYLGNILRTFANIVGHQINDRDNIDRKLPEAQKVEIIKARSGHELLKPFMELEKGFCLENNFTDWWCLEYIYRINFVYDPTASYFNWDTKLEYTTEIARVGKTWEDLKKFTPLICYEGVHYSTESDRPIPSMLYGKVKEREMPSPPEPEPKPETEPEPKPETEPEPKPKKKTRTKKKA